MKCSWADINYIFLTGTVRAMEARGLTKDTLSRILKADSVREGLEILKNTIYFDYYRERDFSDNYDDLIAWRRSALYDFIAPHIVHPALLQLMAVPYDYHNLKVCLKDRIYDRDNKDIMVPWGRIAVDELRDIFNNEAYNKLPEHMHRALEQAVEIYYSSKDPAVPDCALDRAMHGHALETAHELGSPVLARYWMMRIDLFNIMFLFRKNIYASHELVSQFFAGGGSIDISLFIEGLSDRNAVITVLDGYDEYKSVAAAAGAYDSGPLALEREADNALTAFLEEYRFLPWGIEAIYIHSCGVETELKILGLVFDCMAAGVDRGLLHQRLPRIFGGRE